MRAPIRPDVGADQAAAGADHARAERAHRHIVGEPISVERRAVMTAARDAVDEQVAAAVRADVTHGHRREALGSRGHSGGISAGQMAINQCLPADHRYSGPPAGYGALSGRTEDGIAVGPTSRSFPMAIKSKLFTGKDTFDLDKQQWDWRSANPAAVVTKGAFRRDVASRNDLPPLR
jgi:hypothetical protein